MHTDLAAIQNITQMHEDSEQRQSELLKLISDNASTSASSLTDRLTAFSSIMPPGPPQIFYGRQSELETIVGMLQHDSPRIALLGPGGIGKTSLAKTAIHNANVVAKYPDRYFVSCDSGETVDDLVLAVAAVLGLELKGKLSRAVLKSLGSKPNCLLVLDNFETPWEPIATRPTVEEFISLLAGMPNVALLVTMRGQERPSSIRWTRPFIPPLQPLTSDAAHSTFMDISDATDEDAACIPELLSLSGNLPLAVTLVASVALYEGCRTVLSRWKANSSMSPLSDGFDKHTSLETSLRISLSSPRMTSRPGALQLLSLLSILPDGISDVDLTRYSLPIPELFQSKSTLLGTSLAYMDGNATRLKVLPPVREIIRKLDPPAHTLLSPLRTHWDGLLKLWQTYKMPSGDLVSRLVENLGNFSAALKYEVEITQGGELRDAVY
ncbi:P-loop containing nucleoside triphosphate hydrolase protein, partial [Roridomyces roridus]